VIGVDRLVRALGVAFKNGALSFRDYLDGEHDPLARDRLTRTYNRPQFERRRQRLRTYALILLDVDRFKSINDRFGHDVGDRVLTAVGAALRLSSGDRVFRVGGEEFAVLLAGCSARDAEKVAARLCGTVRGLDIGFPVTVSAGVAWCGDPRDHEVVYRQADRALYLAKSSGRDRVAAILAAAQG
jgi:diguanylate cyclase (GGDEF)-like protein